MTLKIEISGGGGEPAQVLANIRRFEDMGFNGVGIGDFGVNGRDVFTLFGAAAVQTSRIALFPSVSNPLTRHPMVLANTAYSLNALAPGRFRMMIGAANDWGTELYMGRKPATVAEMRACFTTLRKLLGGETVMMPGGGRLDGIKGAPTTQAVLSVAVAGPRMTELAGEVGDDVMTVVGHERRVIALVRSWIEKGAARVGRSLDGVEVADWAWVQVDDDEEAAYGKLWGELKRYVHSTLPTLEALGLEWDLDRLDDVPEPEWRQYIDAVAFVGPAEKIAEQFQDIARSGHLDRVVCGISGPDNEVALQSFVTKVLPRVK
jgi:5,10-methylenetetrahydromethanopterin reductase